jgi:hypothetical protein
MLHFLLTYSLTEGRLVDLKEFEDSAVAGRAYVEAEKRNRRGDDTEIVLVGADSIEALKTTHSLLRRRSGVGFEVPRGRLVTGRSGDAAFGPASHEAPRGRAGASSAAASASSAAASERSTSSSVCDAPMWLRPRLSGISNTPRAMSSRR